VEGNAESLRVQFKQRMPSKQINKLIDGEASLIENAFQRSSFKISRMKGYRNQTPSHRVAEITMRTGFVIFVESGSIQRSNDVDWFADRQSWHRHCSPLVLIVVQRVRTNALPTSMRVRGRLNRLGFDLRWRLQPHGLGAGVTLAIARQRSNLNGLGDGFQSILTATRSMLAGLGSTGISSPCFTRLSK